MASHYRSAKSSDRVLFVGVISAILLTIAATFINKANFDDRSRAVDLYPLTPTPTPMCLSGGAINCGTIPCCGGFTCYSVAGVSSCVASTPTPTPSCRLCDVQQCQGSKQRWCDQYGWNSCQTFCTLGQTRSCTGTVYITGTATTFKGKQSCVKNGLCPNVTQWEQCHK